MLKIFTKVVSIWWLRKKTSKKELKCELISPATEKWNYFITIFWMRVKHPAQKVATSYIFLYHFSPPFFYLYCWKILWILLLHYYCGSNENCMYVFSLERKRLREGTIFWQVLKILLDTSLTIIADTSLRVIALDF